MADPIELSEHRKPVTYTLHIIHHWNGTIEVLVDDVAETERNKESIVWAMKRALLALENGPVDPTLSPSSNQWRQIETDPPPLDIQILASNGDDQESGEFQRHTYKNYVKCYPEAHDDLYRLEIKDLGTMWSGSLNGLTHWRLLPPPPALQGED